MTSNSLVMSFWNNIKKSFSKVGDWIKSLGIAKWWRSATGQELSGAQQEANAFSAQQAEIQREYETQMSNTAYQRQVADMRNAGLNPALMYGGSASGASTPSVSSASSVDPGQPGLNPIGLLAQIQQLHLLKSQKANIDADTAKKHQDIKESDVRIDQIHANTANLLKELDLMDVNIRKLGLEGDALEIANSFISREKEMSLYVSGLTADKIVAETNEANKRIEKLNYDEKLILQDIAESKSKIRLMLSEQSLNVAQIEQIKHLNKQIDANTSRLIKEGKILDKDIKWYTHDKIAGDVSTVTGGISDVVGVGKLFNRPVKR